MSTYGGWLELDGLRQSADARPSSLLRSHADEPRASTTSEPTPVGERPHTVLLQGRERVRDVLEPHLGATCALERANNIAQALALEDAQPDAVAFEMLRQLPSDARRQLAAAVRREWLAVEFAAFRARAAHGL